MSTKAMPNCSLRNTKNNHSVIASGSGVDLLPVLEPLPLPASDVRAGDAVRQLGQPRPHQGAAHPLHDLRSVGLLSIHNLLSCQMIIR